VCPTRPRCKTRGGGADLRPLARSLDRNAAGEQVAQLAVSCPPGWRDELDGMRVARAPPSLVATVSHQPADVVRRDEMDMAEGKEAPRLKEVDSGELLPGDVGKGRKVVLHALALDADAALMNRNRHTVGRVYREGK
jgi:hypothetical protein